MKGFGSRERYGLIVFLCLVTVLLAVGPIAERSGCTRRYDAVPHGVHPEAGYGSANINAPDTVADTRAASSDSTRTKRKRKKKSAPNRKPADPQRRNFLDEPL